MLFVTTEPAPTNDFGPISIPGSIVELAPIETPSLILVSNLKSSFQ